MLKIGDFSRLSHLTVKALRFYEKEGLLLPAQTDPFSGYRYYETRQLRDAARIRAYRELELSIEEIRHLQQGGDERLILSGKAAALQARREEIDVRLSIINRILKENSMKEQVIIKEIPSVIVYSTEVTLPVYADLMQAIPAIGAECMALNPTLKCAEPPYEFCEYLDKEHRDTNVRIRHSEAVTAFGRENEHIRFRRIPAVKVLSACHHGAYETIGEAYAYIMKYAEENGYTVTGLARECYIDGIWNKQDVADWLTEIQLPIA